MEQPTKKLGVFKAVNVRMETLYLGFSFYLMFQFIKKPNSIKLQ